MIIEQSVVSFIAAMGFAIIFNAPRQSLWQCGTVGMFGWLVYVSLARILDVNIVIATLVAAIVVGIYSQVLAKWFRTPIIIFNIAGIIPLVPGGLSYDAMYFLVTNNYDLAISSAATAAMISGAIALGLIVSEIINQIIRNTNWRKYHNEYDRKGVTR
ncbi:threonine/serine exporter family protein [Amphibacillus sp. MSJ-3]|uniref:threonine/serine exporter family protein n=1 Tax=Amphibacillus sp. MSJ-3 TaxID=2841505 RepID=UPI001C0F0E3C|nr:threonine/serine exporter family protein [Amphibacillus sp. MSJ-3]MBU5595613.1 threonine/serine exporter family protein [Amphibacillus sp. MSJ-3]